jgi:hypothetical protein
MPEHPDQPTAADDEDAVTVICAHSYLDVQLDRYAFVFHIADSRRRFTLHHANPTRYRLGHTYRLSLTPAPCGGHPPAQQPEPAEHAA